MGVEREGGDGYTRRAQRGDEGEERRLHKEGSGRPREMRGGTGKEVGIEREGDDGYTSRCGKEGSVESPREGREEGKAAAGEDKCGAVFSLI